MQRMAANMMAGGGAPNMGGTGGMPGAAGMPGMGTAPGTGGQPANTQPGAQASTSTVLPDKQKKDIDKAESLKQEANKLFKD